MLRASIGFALLLAAISSGVAMAQSLDPVDPPVLLRTIDDADRRVTIPVSIGGNGPYSFVVDTGSQRTVISRELADHLNLSADAPVRVVSMTGSADVATVTLPGLSFGTTTMAPVQAPVFSDEYIGGPGLLGLDGLRAKRLVLDFRHGRMTIDASRATVARDPDMIVVTARSKAGQLILMDAEADGCRVQIILDTGSEYSVGNSALLAKLTKKQPGRFADTVTMTSVTGDTLRGQWGALDRVKVGSLTLAHVPVMFAEASPFAELGLSHTPALLLGIGALRVFDRVAIDFGRKRVDFLPPDQSALPSIRLAVLSRGLPVN